MAANIRVPCQIAQNSGNTDPGKLAFSDLVDLAGACRNLEAAILDFCALNFDRTSLDHPNSLGRACNQAGLSQQVGDPQFAAVT